MFLSLSIRENLKWILLSPNFYLEICKRGGQFLFLASFSEKLEKQS